MRAEPVTDDIHLAQRGDMAAFERLYRAHTGRVTALCLRLTADRQRAEELMQDTFVRAWEKLESFRGESSFSTWLHRVTVNLFLVGQRSDSRRLARVESDSNIDELPVANYGSESICAINVPVIGPRLKPIIACPVAMLKLR